MTIHWLLQCDRKELKLMAGSAFRFHFDGDSMITLCYDLEVNNEEAYVCSVGSTQVNADTIFDVFVLWSN